VDEVRTTIYMLSREIMIPEASYSSRISCYRGNDRIEIPEYIVEITAGSIDQPER
jgi:hypothetical protein